MFIRALISTTFIVKLANNLISHSRIRIESFYLRDQIEDRPIYYPFRFTLRSQT